MLDRFRSILDPFRRRQFKSVITLTAGCILVASLFTAIALWRGRSGHKHVQAQVTSVRTRTTMVVTSEKRKVYPYSIVPGGARTVLEAKRAMSDPAVRDHYAAVDIKNLRQMTLKSDMQGYVSYRYGGKNWTAKKVHLKAGETVFTDGDHIVRGRCLNCYSAMPMMPTRHNEPSENTLNSPVEVPLIALSFPNLPLAAAPALAPPLAPVAPVPAVVAGGAPVQADIRSGGVSFRSFRSFHR